MPGDLKCRNNVYYDNDQIPQGLSSPTVSNSSVIGILLKN